MNERGRVPLMLLGAVVVLLAWSAVKPHDYPTWALEVFPALVGLVVLGATYRRFPLTPLCYTLIALHMAILIVGGKYTYALVPAGDLVKEALHLSRNHYDRLGHLAQGFVPAMIAREILLRHQVVRRGWWLVLIVFCICMAISALYELVEWAVAMVSAQAAESFLGTQGDQWDTQEDMACCGVGALASLAVLSTWQDRQLAKIKPRA